MRLKGFSKMLSSKPISIDPPKFDGRGGKGIKTSTSFIPQERVAIKNMLTSNTGEAKTCAQIINGIS